MKVAAYSGAGQIRIQDLPSPRVGDGEILLSLSFCGLCGTDLFKIAGDTVESGTVLGHEIVGTVDAVGPDARDAHGRLFEMGDRVVVPHHVPCGECRYCLDGSETMCRVFKENLLSPGGFAEKILVKERATRLAARVLPPELSDEAAVFLEPAACVLRGIDRVAAAPGACCVVLGAGSMGLLHALVLKAVDPTCEVIVVDPIEERQNLARELGCHASSPEDVGNLTMDLCDSRGADAIYDTVGGERVLQSALSLCREGGRVVLFAHAPHGGRADLDLNTIFKGERSIVSTYSGALKEQERVFALLCSGALDPRPLITASLPLDRLAEAVDRVQQHRDLKVLMHP